MNSTTTLSILLLLVSSLTPIPLRVKSRIIEVPGDYSTIRLAINEANPGDTVEVASGTYFESLKITKPLNLIGEGPDNTTIVGNGTVVSVNVGNVEISGFTVRDGTYGIFLWYCSGVLLRNNVMSGNKWNFGIWGDSPSHFTHDIDSSNLVDGKPIYFWLNQHGKHVPKDAGYVALVNCTDITVGDLSLTSNEQGVLLVNTSHSLVENVTMLGNDEGIVLRISHKNAVKMNNLVSINWHAIYCVSSHNNTFTENTIRDGTYGIITEHSDGNTVYHNNFINNKVQLYQINSSSTWDNGREGNYWSDYQGEDLDGDGVGDTVKPHLEVDYYPLINIIDGTAPIADAGKNQTVFRNAVVFFDAGRSTDNFEIIDYRWNFGDGSNGSGVATNHTYDAAGVYTVTLSVTDVSGNIATDVILITVVDPAAPFIWWILLAVIIAVAVISPTIFWLRKYVKRKRIKDDVASSLY